MQTITKIDNFFTVCFLYTPFVDASLSSVARSFVSAWSPTDATRRTIARYKLCQAGADCSRLIKTGRGSSRRKTGEVVRRTGWGPDHTGQRCRGCGSHPLPEHTTPPAHRHTLPQTLTHTRSKTPSEQIITLAIHTQDGMGPRPQGAGSLLDLRAACGLQRRRVID